MNHEIKVLPCSKGGCNVPEGVVLKYFSWGKPQTPVFLMLALTVATGLSVWPDMPPFPKHWGSVICITLVCNQVSNCISGMIFCME